MKEARSIALVTGASRPEGIGTAVCRALAAAGMDVFFTHWGAFDELEGNGAAPGWPDQLVRELAAIGARAAHMEADLADPASPAAILDAVEEAFGRPPSVLVNNATYERHAGFRELDAAILDRHHAVNVRGTVLLSTEFAKRLESSRPSQTPGRIVFLVSKGPDPGNLAYIATKGAVIGIIEPLSVALAPLGITVNGFDPGPTDTGWIDGELRERFLPMFPMGRIGMPEDAARGIAFLAGDASGWITGQVIRSEGGFLGK
ncbi:SDR family oxidoreductase [Paenibacillus sp. D51F]